LSPKLLRLSVVQAAYAAKINNNATRMTAKNFQAVVASTFVNSAGAALLILTYKAF